MARWWSEKYGRPTTSPLFQNATRAELLEEFCADLFAEREQLRQSLHKKDEKVYAEKRLKVIDHVLDGKPLRDEFEEALERGQRPKLLEWAKRQRAKKESGHGD